ncbi:MAG: hypothetical protein N2517_04435 [Ignavibacteria bacterium]|nr:hypothetical protein [Ignavibacteria bacterium]
MIKFYVFIFFFFFSLTNFAQFKDLALEFSISPTSVFGNESITSVFIKPEKKDAIGGGFFGFQNGFALNAVWKFDHLNFEVPIGVDLVFYRAYHRVPYSPRVTLYLRHFIDVSSFVAGFRYFLFKLPFANVRAYSELDLMANFVGKSNYSVRIDYEAYDSTVVRNVSHKNAAFRLGSRFKFGFLGEVVHPWYVNLHLGVGYLNLVGRNHKRGELLTPSSDYEKAENPVYNFQLAVGVYYKF